MPTHLFSLRMASLARSASTGFPALVEGRIPLPAPPPLTLAGVTRDYSGAILGSVRVQLIRTADNAVVATTVSDPTTGAYSFTTVGYGSQYRCDAYLVGSPDRFGTTLNTLQGS
jgi:hypothetical protein